MADPIDEFMKFAKELPKDGDGIISEYSVRMFKAVRKELRRLRADEQRRVAIAQRNGRAGGRPRAPDDKIKPESLKRRATRAGK